MPLLLGTPPDSLVPLILPSPEVLGAAEAMLPGASGGLWARPDVPRPFLGSGMAGHHSRPGPNPPRYNVLHWPAWGLSRWASGHFLASAQQATEVRELAFGTSGTQYNPLTLRMHAELAAFVAGDSSQSVDHRVFVLPPKPIGRPDPLPGLEFNVSEGLYVLTVVDERFRLRNRPVPTDLTIDRDSTWQTLLADLASAVLDGRSEESPSPSFTWPAVSEEWGKPHPSLLDGRYTNLPHFVDAVAASVGLRVVALRDGNFEAMTPTTSQAARNASDLTSGTPRIRYRLAGGIIRAQTL